MIIIMETGAEQGKVAHIIKHLEEKGLQPVPLVGTERTVIAVIGEERDLNVSRLEALPTSSAAKLNQNQQSLKSTALKSAVIT